MLRSPDGWSRREADNTANDASAEASSRRPDRPGGFRPRLSWPAREHNPRYINEALLKVRSRVQIQQATYLGNHDLYRPIKVHLERLGLEVKGEACGCDLVALSDASPELVVIGEMKQSLTLELVLQAVDRTSRPATRVWLAVSTSKRGRGRKRTTRA